MTPEQTSFVSLLLFYLLIGLRFTGLMFSAPAFMAGGMPMPLRFWCAFFLTLTSIGTVSNAGVSLILFESWISVFLLALREFFIGTVIGFISALPLYALQISGELIGISMGFAMVSLMDPLSETRASIIGQLQFLVGLWFFFRWNGHLIMTQSVVESLKLVPPGRLVFWPLSDLGLGKWLQQAFVLSLRFVLPFYGAILLADVGLGFLARTVPQMNIFVLGLPLKIALGFFVLLVVLPVAVEIMAGQMEKMAELALMEATAWR
ncbi:MAG: flagellar biosynthetic protein FliR [Aminivibrio sp.]|jgi:flagellar biosynthetic protein FliR|nr:flagellar biosynthetic protein FliR [Synergistaceae bacterium]